jgi:triphosphatase
MARPLTTDADLSGDLTPDAALRRIVAACHTDIEKYRAVVLANRRPIGIHQTRVALRRLRAAFGLLGAASDDSDVTSLSAEARWIAGELAPARDLHVFLTETAPRDADGVEQPIPRIGRRLALERHQRARQALSGPRYDDFAARLRKMATAAPQPSPATLLQYGAEAMTARHDKVHRRGERINHLGEKRLHKLRIAVKKLRYAAMFLKPVYSAPRSGSGFDKTAVKAYIEATARLQGVLGSLNDKAVAAEVSAAIAQAARPSEKVDKPLARIAKEAKQANKRDHKKLARAWKAFRELEPFWRA